MTEPERDPVAEMLAAAGAEDDRRRMERARLRMEERRLLPEHFEEVRLSSGFLESVTLYECRRCHCLVRPTQAAQRGHLTHAHGGVLLPPEPEPRATAHQFVETDKYKASSPVSTDRCADPGCGLARSSFVHLPGPGRLP